MNRREFLRTLGIVWVWAAVAPSFSQGLASTLALPQQDGKEKAESKEVSKEEIAEIATRIIFEFCNERIEKNKRFEGEEAEKVKADFREFLENRPLCSLQPKCSSQPQKLQLNLNKQYADDMAAKLIGHFASKFNWWVKTAVRVFGKEWARWAIARCLEKGRFCKPEKIFIEDIAKVIANINTEIVQESETISAISIGEFFECMHAVFWNVDFGKKVEGLRKYDEEYLQKPLEELDYDDFCQRVKHIKK